MHSSIYLAQMQQICTENIIQVCIQEYFSKTVKISEACTEGIRKGKKDGTGLTVILQKDNYI